MDVHQQKKKRLFFFLICRLNVIPHANLLPPVMQETRGSEGGNSEEKNRLIDKTRDATFLRVETF